MFWGLLKQIVVPFSRLMPGGPYEVGFKFLVSPKGHPIYALTNIKKEPYVNSPITVMYTLLHINSSIEHESLADQSVR